MAVVYALVGLALGGRLALLSAVFVLQSLSFAVIAFREKRRRLPNA